MWRNFQAKTRQDKNWPIPLLESGDKDQINYWLGLVICEIRRKDATSYPPDTLNNIAAGLQRYMNLCKRLDINIFKKEDTTFTTFRNVLNIRRKLINLGFGLKKRQAAPVTHDDEHTIWEKGVFTEKTSKGVSYIMYVYNCKMFAFRARDEHVNLMVEQFSFGLDSDG